MSRTRRKPKPPAARGRGSRPGAAGSAGGASSQRITHYAAPVAFLAAVTIAVLLVHSGLSHHAHTAATTTQSTPTASTATKTKPTGTKKRFYVVQAGDTYGTIASKEGISVAQLQAFNPGVSSNALQVGQRLRVK